MSRYSGWDDAAVRKAANRAPKSKYGATKVCIDGIWFDSKREGMHYVALRTMDAAGLISHLVCHPSYRIGIKGVFICDVVLDFQYYDNKLRQEVYQDVKGHDNPLSQLKRKLVEAEYGISVEIIK